MLVSRGACAINWQRSRAPLVSYRPRRPRPRAVWIWRYNPVISGWWERQQLVRGQSSSMCMGYCNAHVAGPAAHGEDWAWDGVLMCAQLLCIKINIQCAAECNTCTSCLGWASLWSNFSLRGYCHWCLSIMFAQRTCFVDLQPCINAGDMECMQAWELTQFVILLKIF